MTAIKLPRDLRTSAATGRIPLPPTGEEAERCQRRMSKSGNFGAEARDGILWLAHPPRASSQNLSDKHGKPSGRIAEMCRVRNKPPNHINHPDLGTRAVRAARPLEMVARPLDQVGQIPAADQRHLTRPRLAVARYQGVARHRLTLASSPTSLPANIAESTCFKSITALISTTALTRHCCGSLHRVHLQSPCRANR
jgi:hypothetical protein